MNARDILLAGHVRRSRPGDVLNETIGVDVIARTDDSGIVVGGSGISGSVTQASLPGHMLAVGLDASYLPGQIYLIDQSTTSIRLTKMQDLAQFTVSGYTTSLCFSRGGYYLAATSNRPPYIAMYKFIEGTYSRLSSPFDVLPTYAVTSVAISASGTYVAVGISGLPRIMVYKRNGDRFTRLNVANARASVTGVAFSPDEAHLICAHGPTGNYVMTVYKRSVDDFTMLDTGNVTFGSGMYAGGGAIAISPDGTILVTSCHSYLYVFSRTGDNYTKVASFHPSASGYDEEGMLAFSADGTKLAAGKGVFFPVVGGVLQSHPLTVSAAHSGEFVAASGRTKLFIEVHSACDNTMPYLCDNTPTIRAISRIDRSNLEHGAAIAIYPRAFEGHV